MKVAAMPDAAAAVGAWREADCITSWDQGFDTDGGQVWGAENRSYVFLRLDPQPAK